MRAVCIIGSPRENGRTAQVVDRIIDGMQSVGVEVRRCVLGSLDVGFCRGCLTCRTTGECAQQDDMAMLVGDLLRADIVLVASPSYWGDVTAQLKAFIDRCLPLCNARTGETSVPPGKRGISVAVRAGSDRAENLHLIETIEHYFGYLGITPVARLTVERVSEPHGLSEARLQEAFDLGAGIVADNGVHHDLP